MAESSSNAFQTGDDFISFDLGSPPPPSGPSRDKGKSEARDESHATPHSTTRASRSSHPLPPRPQIPKREKGKAKMNGKAYKGSSKKRKAMEDDEIPLSESSKKNKVDRRGVDSDCPWAEYVDWEGCRDPAEMLNEEILSFYKYMSPSRIEYEVRLCMIEIITRVIMDLWPEAEVFPFGSWQTQLYLPSGDIDLVVTTKQMTETNKAMLLAKMAQAMRMAKITQTVAIISKARVPIIKFVTLDGHLNVDISLNQSNGIFAGRIINQYLDVLPGSRQLILVVKAFLSQRSMNEVFTGGIGSYAVICLVISFLQVHPKLRRSEMDPEENLGVLLVELFGLYGRDFNYDDNGISIRQGGYYYLKSKRGWLQHNKQFLLSIEDPQDPDNDISGGSYGIRQVRAVLAGAWDLLTSQLFERAEQITGRRSGRYPQPFGPHEMSILGKIVGINKNVRKHREELSRLHHEGKLQRILSIPHGADPTRHLRGHSPPTRPGDRVHDNPLAPVHDGPSRYDSKGKGKGKSPLNAIVVDDEEVDEFDDEESGSDGVHSTDDRYEEIEGLTEEEEWRLYCSRHGVKGRSGGEKRVMSVSEDEHEVPQREEEVESRYDVGKNGRGVGGKAKQNKREMEVELDDADLDILNSSDDSVVEITKMPSPKKGKKKDKDKDKAQSQGKAEVSGGVHSPGLVDGGNVVGNGKAGDQGQGMNGTSSSSKIEVDPEGRIHKKSKKGDTSNNGTSKAGADKKARKEFWVAKGLNGSGSVGDEFEDGTDYVGLD